MFVVMVKYIMYITTYISLICNFLYRYTVMGHKDFNSLSVLLIYVLSHS